jgi:hypothetical protein
MVQRKCVYPLVSRVIDLFAKCPRLAMCDRVTYLLGRIAWVMIVRALVSNCGHRLFNACADLFNYLSTLFL